MTIRRLLWATVVAVAASAVGGVGAAAQSVPDYYPADYPKMIDASRSEAGLVLYTNAPRDSWETLIQAFNARYPWIKVESLDLDSGEIVERHVAETASGARTADILIHQSLEGWVNLKEREAIEPYHSPEADKLVGVADQGDGVYAIFIDPTVFVWNKLLVSEDLAPKSMSDLAAKATAHPDVFHGKIATQGPGMSAAGYTNHYAYLNARGDQGWENLRAIGPNVRLESSIGPMLEKLLAGEYVLAYFVQQQPVINRIVDPAVAQVLDQRLGASEDGVPLISRAIAVTKTAASPNSARLFLDFALSKPGQIALGKTKRSIVRLDVTSAEIDGTQTFADTVKAIGEENLLSVGIAKDAVNAREEFLKKFAEVYTLQ